MNELGIRTDADLWGNFAHWLWDFSIYTVGGGLLGVAVGYLVYRLFSKVPSHTRFALSIVSFAVVGGSVVSQFKYLGIMCTYALPFIGFCMYLDQRAKDKENS